MADYALDDAAAADDAVVALGDYQSTGPLLSLAAAAAVAVTLADAAADAVSLAAAVIEPPALASYKALVRSSAIFFLSASSSY